MQLFKSQMKEDVEMNDKTEIKTDKISYKKYYRQIPKPVDAIDTLGAGDSFTTAFLLSLLDGEKIETAMEKGAEFAAKTCMVRGAFGYGVPFEDPEPGDCL